MCTLQLIARRRPPKQSNASQSTVPAVLADLTPDRTHSAVRDGAAKADWMQMRFA